MGRALDPDFVLGVAADGGVLALGLEQRLVLGEALGVVLGKRLVRVLPILRGGMPVPELDLDVPVVLGRDRPDLALGRLGLRSIARVHEHVRRICGHDQALAELLLEIVAELPGVESLGQRVRSPVLEQANLQSPVVTHGAQTMSGRVGGWSIGGGGC